MVSDVTPLVGRAAELRRLLTALARADSGKGSLALISGEAGIGKTRLCAELRKAVGAPSLTGYAAPGDASLPYAALADSLRAARRSAPQVWAAALARAEILGTVVPELAATTGAPERPADRLVLFEALLDAVDEAAGEAAMLWILDDIHWADSQTWDFVRYAARRLADLHLVLVVTYREEEISPSHPWWAGLVRLKQEPAALALRLPRLSPDDSARVARAIRPGLPAENLADVVRRGAGTPLLVEELATLAASPGGLAAVPDVVRATVWERSSRLGVAERALLDVAAVAGVAVDADLLASILPASNPEDLVTVGLLDREQDRFRFRHPLFQDAVYQQLPIGRRRELHEQIADAMCKSDNSAAETVAAHLERADLPAAALSVLQAAAGDAARRGNGGRKATLQLCALETAWRYRSLADRRAELERAVIGDLFATGRWTEVDPLLRAAWAERDRRPHAERARLAAMFCLHLFWSGSMSQALSVAAQELADLERAGVPDLGGPLLRELALVAWYHGDGMTARRSVDRALEIARRTGDVESELRALRTEAHIAYGERGDPEAALAKLDQHAAVARAHGLAVPESFGRLLRSLFTAELHGLKTARHESEHADWSWLAAMYEATYYLMEGDYAQSEEIFGQIRHGYRLRVPTIAAWVDSKEACLYVYRGDLAQARALLDGPNAASEAASCGLIGAEWAVARGWLAWEEGRMEDACAQLGHACSESMLSMYNTISPGPAYLPLLVDALLRLGRVNEAAEAVSTAEAFNLGHSRFATAGLAVARFRLAPAPALARAAQASAAAAPWPWLEALTGCWRGEFLGDAAAAEAARAQFAAVGAPRGARQAEAVLRGLGVEPPERARDDSVLSRREMEVAELIAEGLTNPAIARRLLLSRPTVATHIAHILAKLGFSSRTQIAAWMARHGQLRSPDEPAR